MIARIVTDSRKAYAVAVMGVVALVCMLGVVNALSQEHHHHHHAFYKNWTNKDGKGCCNDQDCGTLASENEREAEERIEVRIEGQWCPVLPVHYLRTGNAPDWSTSHVCVLRRGVNDPRGPCERFICYQPRPRG